MNVVRTGILLKPDSSRVLLSPFKPPYPEQTLARILSLTEDEVNKEYNVICEEFGRRHRNIQQFFKQRNEYVRKSVLDDRLLSENRKNLIGAYFTSEYSIESAALFNPSIVWHPDQSNLQEGNRKFILSLRATGEGHISSIVFHTGIIDKNAVITLDESSRYVTAPDEVFYEKYEKEFIDRIFFELKISKDVSKQILSKLGTTLSIIDLKTQIELSLDSISVDDLNRTKLNRVLAIARSNYEVKYSNDKNISERIIFPHGPTETNGIEDARFVRFENEDGSFTYFATYTAYDGYVIHPQLIETRDFRQFKISTMHGSEVKNKGMALFPRKINGKFATISRQDGENLYIMFSDNILFWNSKQLLLKPKFNWELVQIGNCGSPIETEKGWLILSHGVGPLRKYSIGALLLNLNDPTKIIGRLKNPLLSSNENERDGYVPNVVYSCGSIISGNDLIIPYAMSDSASSFAKVNLNELLKELSS